MTHMPQKIPSEDLELVKKEWRLAGFAPSGFVYHTEAPFEREVLRMVVKDDMDKIHVYYRDAASPSEGWFYQGYYDGIGPHSKFVRSSACISLTESPKKT